MKFAIWHVLCGVLLAGAASAARADEPTVRLQLIDAPVGQVYQAGETIALSVIDAPGDRVEIIVADPWGKRATWAKLETHGEKVTAEVADVAPGFYTVQAVPYLKNRKLAAAATRLMVVEPYDLSKAGDTPFGVMTHFAQGWDTDLIEPLARVGIQHVRDEIYWDSVEKSKGQYAFPDQFEKYMGLLKAHHMRPLIPMTFGNKLYDAPEGVPTWAAAPYTEAGFEGYANYCRAVLGHYGKQIQQVEIWNEYNGGFARGPADGRAEVYAQMLRIAYEAIKKDRPDVQVLAGGTIGVPLDWIEQVIQHAGIDHMDGISVHPYGYTYPPELHVERLEALRALICKYNGGHDKPIVATEQGYYLIKPGEYGNHDPITEMTKAAYLVRAWTLFNAHGVDATFWYLARNDKHFGTMGLFGAPDDPAGRYAPLPSAMAYATMIRQLRDLPYTGQDQTPDGIYSFRYGQDAQQVRVMWATDSADVMLESEQPVQVVGVFGKCEQVQPVAGGAHVHLSGMPVFVCGDLKTVTRSNAFKWGARGKMTTGEPLVVDSMGGKSDSITSTKVIDGERWVRCTVSDAHGRVVYTGVDRIAVSEPVVLDGFARMQSTNEVTLVVTNHSSQRPCRLTAARWTIDRQERRKDLDVTILPGQQANVKLAIDSITPWTIHPFSAELTTDDGRALKMEHAISRNVMTRRTVKVDGQLDDWVDVPGIDLDAAGYRKLAAERNGPGDLGGRMMLCGDEENLYVAATIRDDRFDQTHTGYSTWKGDNIQLGIAADMPWAGGDGRGAQSEIGLTLTPQGPEIYRFHGPGPGGPIQSASLVVKRHENTTIYECAIPWSQLGVDPQSTGISFGVYINDADGSGRKGYLQWADIKRLSQMQAVYRKLS